MKVPFKILAKKDSFWVKVIRSKYNYGSEALPD